MQDSTITYRVTTTGIEEAEAKFRSLGATVKSVTVNQNGTVTATGQLTREQAELAAQTGRASAATDRAAKSQGNYFVHIAKTTVQSALVNKAFLGLVEAAGQAVKQVDLMQNFPASMAALGLSASDARDSLGVLRDYIAQVGGNLTDATTSVARFAEVTKNVKAATAEFVGVNNALIAGGAGAQVQSNALEQLIQAYSRGKPQLIEWRSLMVAMPAQLNQVAKAMNLPNAQALGEALTAGDVSMQDFLTQLTKLATGTGPIAQQAIARMQGIQFATNVMKNALTNGLAAIYQAVGRQNIIAFFNFLTQVIIVLTGWAVGLINILITLFNLVSRIFGGPQIAHFNGEAQGAADALGSGADNAGDMADNLDDAGKSAKRLNKSLASFDKMNVLPDKTSGDSGKGGGGGAGGLSPADASALDDIFGNIGKKLQEISGWAKLFAGILAGIAAAKYLAPIVRSLGDIIKGFKDGATAADSFSKKLGGAGKNFKDAFKGNTGVKDAVKAGGSFGNSILQGLGAALGAGAGKVWKFLIAPLIGVAVQALALIGAIVVETLVSLGVVAAAVTVPLWALVAIGVAVVAAIVAAVWLIWKNWDTIWGFIKKAASASWQFIQKVWDGITGFFVKLWQGIYDNAIKPVVDKIESIFTAVVGFFQKWGKLILEIIFWPVLLGIAFLIVVVSIIIAIFQTLWDGIKLIFSVVAAFFTAVFSAAWIAITVVWSVVVAFFQSIWDGIVAVFTVVATFLGKMFSDAWNAIVAVWKLVSGWFNVNVIQPVITFFTPVTNFLGGVFSKAWDAIKSVWNAVAGFFGSVWSGVKNAFGDVAGFFGNMFRNAYDRITSVFSGLWSWFKTNVWDRITSLFSNVGKAIGDVIGGVFKAAVNAVLSTAETILNAPIKVINGMIDKVDGILPGNQSSWKLDLFHLPRLAKGGIIDQPTIAQLGEAGKEAVVPLENNTEWIDMLASKINDKNKSGQPVQLVVQIGEDKIASKMIDLINEKTIMSGRNAIYV